MLAALCMGCSGDDAPSSPPAGDAASVLQPLERESIAPVAVAPVVPLALPAEPAMSGTRLPVAEVAAGQWAAARSRVRRALVRGDLIQTAESALPVLLAMQRVRPDDRWVAGQMGQARRQLLSQFNAALEQPERQRLALSRAAQLLGALQQIDPDDPALADADRALREARERLALNRRGESRLRGGPAGVDTGRALADFQQVLERWPEDARALQGVAAVELAILRQAEVAADSGDFARAAHLLAQAGGLREPAGTVEAATVRIERARDAQVQALYQAGMQDISTAAGLRLATERLATVRGIAHAGDRRVDELERRITLATHYGQYAPGQVFRDRLAVGGHGPQMVVVPRGQFLMGAPALEAGAAEAEQPVHTVRFERGFAMAINEVTVAQFGRFVAEAGARPRATRRGHSTVYEPRTGNFIRRSGVDWRSNYLGQPAAPDDPVMHVSVRDAEAYAAWLSEQTGHNYRLPSEAEFEYVLRAGRTGRYPWGDAATPPPMGGNLTGEGDVSPTGRRWANAFAGYADGWWGAAPAGHFAPNPFGLYDTEGNLSEWVADCWHASYRRAPSDGAAWYNPGCRQRVVRGANWANAPVQARAAWRWQQESDVTNARIGFRVVRGL